MFCLCLFSGSLDQHPGIHHVITINYTSVHVYQSHTVLVVSLCVCVFVFLPCVASPPTLPQICFTSVPLEACIMHHGCQTDTWTNIFAQLVDLEAVEQLIHSCMGLKPAVKDYSVAIGSIVE